MNPKQPKILVTGAKGQVGHDLFLLQSQYNYDFSFKSKLDLDISDASSLQKVFQEFQPDFMINSAAYTAVDTAEDDPKTCAKINHEAIKEIVQQCNQNDCHLIHFSTDYVFDGNSQTPYLESAIKNPINTYGKTKSEGEEFIIKNSNSYTIIRTSWVYSAHGKNFFLTMTKLGQDRQELSIVSDQQGCPTYAHDLAKTTLNIIPKLRTGDKEIYHYTNSGQTTWAEFAEKIFEIQKQNCTVNKINTSEYPTKAQRPMFSCLDTKKIKEKFKIEIAPWEEALARCQVQFKNQK